MKTLILNDLHLGVKRQAGTTKQSRKDLEDWMLQQFEECLKTPHERLIILGDLFDKRNVEEHVMAEVIKLLYLEDCYIVQGNHDVGGIEDHTLSSCEFVANLSESFYVDKSQMIGSYYIVPHLHSQEDFDHAVQICPDNTIMMVHCNIDSPFAHGDHSLNLSLHQMKDLEKRGVDVLAGHEHTKRDVHNVTILGNQFPSSISDCIGGDKFSHLLDGEELFESLTWSAKDDFYSDEAVEDSSKKFIRITGECDVSSYSEIVKAVANLRKDSEAFIVKNAVKVKEFTAEKTGETVTNFNILDMLLEEIPEGFREEVRSCL